MTTTWGGSGLTRSHPEIQQHVLKVLTCPNAHTGQRVSAAQTHPSVKEPTTVLPLEPRPRSLSLRVNGSPSKVAPTNPTSRPPQAPTKPSLPIQDLAFSKVLQIPTICTALLLRRKSTCSTPRYHWLHLPPNPKPPAAGPNDQLKAPPQTLHAQPGTPLTFPGRCLRLLLSLTKPSYPFINPPWAALLSRR